MSEMELSILPQRAHEALKQKARRGELFTTVAIGYVRSGPDQIDRDPDLRVREALALVFRKFVELQSVRQLNGWPTRSPATEKRRCAHRSWTRGFRACWITPALLWIRAHKR